MALYRRGAKGQEVSRIQARLRELGYYAGPIDGDFGGGTEAGVRAFQRVQGLEVDGTVGAKTWAALFRGGKIAEPAIVRRPLTYRCLALTGAFETGAPIPECFAGLSGDFDGQGISFGALQWNLGQGTLQRLLQDMDRTHPQILKGIFHQHYPVLRAMLAAQREEQLAWARSIQDPRRSVLHEPWRGLFKTLGRRDECQGIQVKFAGRLYRAALALCKTYRVQSERAVALMFDIKVQNGSISELVKAQIMEDFTGIDRTGDRDAAEVARLRIIANRRAEAAHPRWVEDVRTRKLTIANGEGTVHGNSFNLEEQYGIRLKAVKAG
ncbi:MAG: peptidoglycan-binding protein [Candidatus Methylomirabilales bacterium]